MTKDEITTAIDVMYNYRDNARGFDYQSRVRACDTAIEALEKQIPKKPIDDEKKMRYYCPNCAEVVAEYYKGVPKRYCPNCGQRLDWSVE